VGESDGGEHEGGGDPNREDDDGRAWGQAIWVGAHSEQRETGVAGKEFADVALSAAMTIARRDEPWRHGASVAAWLQARRGRHLDTDAVTTELLRARDLLVRTVRSHPLEIAVLAVAQPLADFIALVFCLLAADVHMNPVAVLAAFLVSNVAGLIPITPGGLGFVEAGLLGVLSLAGGPARTLRSAVVIYRLAATWLPTVAGFGALVAFQRRRQDAATT
jgi:hypothetical protein